MQTPDSPSPPPEPEYFLLLPDPASATVLASGMAGAIEPEVPAALERLITTRAATTPEQIPEICNTAMAGLGPLGPVADDEPSGFYDLYFAVRRLPASAGKTQILRAMTMALAVVMKNTARLEGSPTGISAGEFALLRQSFSTIAEILRELATEPPNNQAP